MRNFHLAGRSTVHAQNAMVATSHPLAALTAIEVMRVGGTAADAAVAASALLAVIEPQSTGIGGDCFALVQPRGEGRIVAYNGSGRAPKAATAEWYLERNMHAIPLTLGACGSRFPARSMPGQPSCAITASSASTPCCSRRSRRQRRATLWPRASPSTGRTSSRKLKKGTNTERYLLPHGKPAVAGDVIRQPELGKTLRAIAKGGRDAFYKGAIAEDMVETLRRIGGLHTLDDFEDHGTETTSPIGTIYKGHDVWQCPPNGPGITMLVMLNILSRFDLTKFPALSVERFHLEAEAARAAYMMREQHIGDPAYVNVDVARILTPEFAEEHAGKIRMDGLRDLPNVAPPMNPSTIYITVVDKGSQRLFVHQFDRALLRFRDRFRQDRHLAAKPRRRFPCSAGPSHCIAPGKRPAAHDHSQPRHQKWPRAKCRSG